jgi:hypothetical protein
MVIAYRYLEVPVSDGDNETQAAPSVHESVRDELAGQERGHVPQGGELPSIEQIGDQVARQCDGRRFVVKIGVRHTTHGCPSTR